MKTLYAILSIFLAAAALGFVADFLGVTTLVSYFLDALILVVLFTFYDDWRNKSE